MTKEQALAYIYRWKSVERFEVEELRNMTPDERFVQLCALFSSAKSFGWEDQLAEQDATGHACWSRLREAYRARHSA